MKNISILFFLIFVLSCKKDHQTNDKNIIKTETIKSKSIKIVKPNNEIIEFNSNSDWQKNFGLTHDIDKDSIWFKEVKFYIENPKCDKTAIAFYFGKFKPTDNEETSKLLQLVITKDNNLRPFYRWILDKTIQIQDGALGEYTGSPARRYAEKFPNEFFEYMDLDTSGEKYSNWYNAILYSGFYEGENFDQPQIVKHNLIKTMKINCKNCNQNIIKKIEKFGLDCFPDIQK